MSDITKLVDKIVPPNERSQNFTEADASAGDIILVQASLGRPAKNVTIEATGGNLVVCFNVKQKVYPNRASQHHNDFMFCDHLPVPALAGDIEVVNGLVTIESGTVYELERDLVIKDIKIVSATATAFDIFVS